MCQFAKSLCTTALAGMVFVSSAVMAQRVIIPTPMPSSVINPIVVTPAPPLHDQRVIIYQQPMLPQLQVIVIPPPSPPLVQEMPHVHVLHCEQSCLGQCSLDQVSCKQLCAASCK